MGSNPARIAGLLAGALLSALTLLGQPAAANTAPDPAPPAPLAVMTAEQHEIIANGGLVVSPVELQAGCEHKFTNDAGSDFSTRLSDWNYVWHTIHVGYYAYGNYRKIEVKSSANQRLWDWSSSGNITNLVTLNNTGWYGPLDRWTGRCAVRSQSLHYDD